MTSVEARIGENASQKQLLPNFQVNTEGKFAVKDGAKIDFTFHGCRQDLLYKIFNLFAQNPGKRVFSKEIGLLLKDSNRSPRAVGPYINALRTCMGDQDKKVLRTYRDGRKAYYLFAANSEYLIEDAAYKCPEDIPKLPKPNKKYEREEKYEENTTAEISQKKDPWKILVLDIKDNSGLKIVKIQTEKGSTTPLIMTRNEILVFETAVKHRNDSGFSIHSLRHMLTIYSSFSSDDDSIKKVDENFISVHEKIRRRWGIAFELNEEDAIKLVPVTYNNIGINLPPPRIIEYSEEKKASTRRIKQPSSGRTLKL